MLTIYDICKQIAKDTNRDYDEICHIARYEFAITKNTMSFSLIITFFTVMKVDEFHNILAAKAAYLFL